MGMVMQLHKTRFLPHGTALCGKPATMRKAGTNSQGAEPHIGPMRKLSIAYAVTFTFLLTPWAPRRICSHVKRDKESSKWVQSGKLIGWYG
jgi:hypothetical protein